MIEVMNISTTHSAGNISYSYFICTRMRISKLFQDKRIVFNWCLIF